MSQPQPACEKLSDQIGQLAAIFGGDVLLPDQLAALVAFHRRYLKDLQLFAADFEYAESRTPGPQALSLAAAASMRFYRRLAAPVPAGEVTTIEFPGVEMPSPGAMVIDFEKFRRPPSGDVGAR